MTKDICHCHTLSVKRVISLTLLTFRNTNPDFQLNDSEPSYGKYTPCKAIHLERSSTLLP